ncbi:hypothetical protein [Ancylomarina sp. 16SWW S1-10-2]|uniref:hypothetical protein n=1 Tax=Ancylomarina sp. 16SWW S1-10-2 TaxID=2499681 RepID=UPI0012ADBBC5|nr:hypothetical protein [Ancylomarina sp. 16SWW S1-10-2]MRT94069.1 hypothetical protein [Ancylomarina sp. 16SWW S1-10-2]
MKTYLPHYFKTIGILFVFIAIVLSFIGGIDNSRQAFMKGVAEGSKSSQELYGQTELTTPKDVDIKPYLTKKESDIYIMISLFFSITGFILYLFSKEKIDDEYIQQIRLKSILQALITTWLTYGLIKLIFKDYQFEGIYILQLQLIVYVIIFKYNKDKELS